MGNGTYVIEDAFSKQKRIELEVNPLKKEISDDITDFSVYLMENVTGYLKKVICDGEKIFLIAGASCTASSSIFTFPRSIFSFPFSSMA